MQRMLVKMDEEDDSRRKKEGRKKTQKTNKGKSTLQMKEITHHVYLRSHARAVNEYKGKFELRESRRSDGAHY